jgi:hypothetical protein
MKIMFVFFNFILYLPGASTKSLNAKIFICLFIHNKKNLNRIFYFY